MNTTSQEFLYENQVYELIDAPLEISISDDEVFIDFHFLQTKESIEQTPKGPDPFPTKFHIKTRCKDKNKLIKRLRALADKIESGDIGDKEDGIFTW